MFGYKLRLCIQKASRRLFGMEYLTTDTISLDRRRYISAITKLPSSKEASSNFQALRASNVILDAIFVFPFKGPARPPFDEALQLISGSRLPIVSVDIPSGWDIGHRNIYDVGLESDVLVSLTSLKLGVKNSKGRHFRWEICPKDSGNKDSSSTCPNIRSMNRLWNCSREIKLRSSKLTGLSGV